MPKYKITAQTTCWYEFYVEADSEDEAEDIALRTYAVYETPFQNNCDEMTATEVTNDNSITAISDAS